MAQNLHTHTHSIPGKLSAERSMREVVFNCGSARARVHRYNSGVCHVHYSGVMSPTCFIHLRENVIDATQDATLLKLQMSKMLMVTDIPPSLTKDVYRANAVPGAVIVRADQYEVWRAYASRLADIGITRVVFLDSQLAQAQRWMALLAGSQDSAETLISGGTSEHAGLHH